MVERKRRWLSVTIVGLTAALTVWAAAPIVQESFNSVSGTGGGVILTGSGFNYVSNWDDGLTGEWGFAGTTGNTRVTAISALGVSNGGVGNTGAGRVIVSGANFNLLQESFDTVTATGGGVFLGPTGLPDTNSYIANWDDGLSGEAAYGGTFGGAIVVGGMSSEGVTAGGVSGTGGGKLTVSDIDITTGNWYAGQQWVVGPLPGASPLYNAGFDDNGGSLANWTTFGNAYTDNGFVHSGTTALKLFGPFSSDWGASGVYQDITAAAGQIWQIDCYTQQITGDSLVGTQNYVVMRMEFYASGGQMIQGDEVRVLDANSPVDTWIDNTPLQITAPAGTARVRAVLVFVQPVATEGGAGYIDTVFCRPVGGPSTVDLSSITLNASVKGTANTGAGETLGEYQLRLEDADGDRLLFRSTANGSWQSIGGPLTTATEADANGVSTAGVFNRHSPRFNVVVAFDNQRAGGTYWGRGGTLAVDNLLLGNTNPAGSSWYAGIYWDALPVVIKDPARLFLSADVLGSDLGGGYALRVEGHRLSYRGIDQNFNTVTGLGGGLFFAYSQYQSGLRFVATTNWDNGITGEGAYGGLSGDAEIFYDGVTPYGFSARGLTAGGQTSGGGEIRVEGIIYGAGSWYAGLQWGNQGLASSDLSQVILSANVKGTAASGGGIGDYELRIEDAQGDRMYFPMRANGSWQQVGGALSTALEGPALNGQGDGNFDLNAASYNVVLAFAHETVADPNDPLGPLWQYGGALAIDNLYLSPVTIRTSLGSKTFTGTANGSTFQNIGGLLSASASTFPDDLAEDFSTVTGTGGGAFLVAGQGNGFTNGWDTGIVGEWAFAGTWGGATVIGDVSAQGCLACGDGNTGGGQIIVNNIQPNAGGWWAGVDWPNRVVDMSDPNLVTLSARVKGTVDPNAGQMLGAYQLRIEDDGLDYLGFTVTANGNWQTIGGPLSTATPGTIGGNNQFNYNAAAYTVTLVFSGTASQWGRGGTLTFDDIFCSGITFADAENYAVTLTFADEINTWGTDGTLTLDNLLLTPAPNCDADNDVDLHDMAQFQRCFNGTGSPPTGCDCADLNSDGQVNMTDFNLISPSFRGPQ